MSQSHYYRICPADPAAHVFEVELKITKPDPDGQRLRMPAWIPGSYMIRDYARHVMSIRAESDGLSVGVHKVDKSTWQCEPCSAPLTVVIEVYAYDPSVRGAHLDRTHGFFNGTCMFLEVLGQEHHPVTLDIEAPDELEWRVATSMSRDGAEAYGFGRYKANDYAELIDHPVEMGSLTIAEFEARGIPHAIAIRGHTHVDLARLTHDLQTICEQHLDFLGIPEDLDRYLFLLNAPGSGYGGLEHRWSSALIAARDNLPVRGQDDVSNGYRTFLGLVSHEYFHLWNVKRLKPAVFSPYKLESESHTELLWVFEGITSYYDDLALRRSGLIDSSSYLELLGQVITRVHSGRGRLRQSVAESSYDAWTKFYKQDANATNAIVSYYAKGALIALCVDLKIRQDSEGRVSLDDVMRECWNRWGNSADGMPESGFESVCAEVSGLDLKDFFDALVRGTGELPLESLLRSHGVEWHRRAPSGIVDKGGKPAKTCLPVSFGANLADNAGKTMVASIANGSPAEAAGLAPGDELLAVDGLRVSTGNLDRRLVDFVPGDVVRVTCFRNDSLLQLEMTFTEPSQSVSFLTLAGDVDATTDSLRRAWLDNQP